MGRRRAPKTREASKHIYILHLMSHALNPRPSSTQTLGRIIGYVDIVWKLASSSIAHLKTLLHTDPWTHYRMYGCYVDMDRFHAGPVGFKPLEGFKETHIRCNM